VEVKAGVIAESIKEESGGLSVGCLEGTKHINLRGDMVLVACGRKPNISVLSAALNRRINPRSRIPESGVPGLYLPGDIVRGRNRQASIAVGDGVLAAMLAQKYLDRRGE
jgi:thioredoxin reductase